jgi:hypothetical protein
MQLRPIAAQTAPGRTLGPRRRAIAAVVTAATGIGHGAATSHAGLRRATQTTPRSSAKEQLLAGSESLR